jgi:hypothetical protein
MRSQVPQRGVVGRHQLRDVIARASTPAHESAEAFDVPSREVQ